MSLLYGCLNLQPSEELTLPFDGRGLFFRRGSHLTKQPVQKSIPGDFILASTESILPTSYVPSRNERIDAVSVGQIHHNAGTKLIVGLLLAINSEKNDMKFSELIHSRLYKNVEGQYLACVSQSGPYSHFIFLANSLKLNIIGVTNEDSMFLVWSNEEALEERLKEETGNKFYFYRFPSLTNGSLVFQTKYLCTRVRRWQAEMRDRLKVFSAVERLIFKNIRS